MFDPDYNKTDYVIQSRIRDYLYDLQSCENITAKDEDIIERIRQDKVIIQELESILYGKGLEVLKFQH